MSSSRAGGGSGSAAIPLNARKTVQSLKEIIPNSEDEIYAVLKECNMDPDETVQKLLNQDPFHEVKRKRDKKKETSHWNKESGESKVRPVNGGTQTRGRGGNVDRGAGRGGSLPRHPSHELSGSRSKAGFVKENGTVNTNPRVGNTFGSPSLSTVPVRGQGKTHPSGLSNQSAPASSAPATPPTLPNCGLGYMRPVSGPHGSWGSSAQGHATMADIVKANGSPLPVPSSTPILSSNNMGAQVASSVGQQFLIPGSESPPASSGVYSSSTDPVLHPALDSRATATSGAIKREIGTVGNQRTKGDWASSSIRMDSLSASPITSQSLQSIQTSTSTPVASPSLDADSQVASPGTPPVSVSPPVLQERPASLSVGESGSSVAIQARHGSGTSSSGGPASRTPVGPFRPVYPQHPVGTQKATGSGLEWKPKLIVQNSGSLGGLNTPSPTEAIGPTSPPSVSGDPGILSATTSKLSGVSIHSDQPVILPNHLQVAEAEQTHLSFGSFTAGFGSSFTSTFVSEESSKKISSVAENTTVIETPVEQSNTSGVVNTAPAALGTSYVHQSISVPEEVLGAGNEIARVSLAPPTVIQIDAPKPDAVTLQGPQYPYLPTIPNYPGFNMNMIQQVPVGQYTYESSETPPQSQPPDVSRLPNIVPYSDPAASYYTPMFRAGSDGDARYSPFVTSNVSNKYNGNMGLFNLAGQNPAPQESGNSAIAPVPTAQTSQTGNGPSLPTIQQQALPLHAYPGQPTGAPMGHHYANVFGYQFIPPNYAYMHPHSPYGHNYPASSLYPQGPTGSNYPNASPTTYPPGGPTTVKYQLSQYKTGNASGITPHSATAGYGSYGVPPSGYGANPPVTVGSTTGYEDVGVQQQYKDSNLFIPSQQVEGSTVWIQAPLSRDMPVGGMQANSYYNLPAQGQHGGYAHAQQAPHAHNHPGAYQSMYHPSQSGQAPTAHQLLQQPQALGASSGSQAGGYQQPQRTQQTWTNNY